MKRLLMCAVCLFSCALLFGGYKFPETEEGNLQRVQDYHKTVSELMERFEKSEDTEYKKSILYALGELRARNAVPFLLKNILFGITTSQVTLKMPKYGSCPAAEALAKIGSPSIDPTIDELKKTKDAKIRFTLIWVVLKPIEKSYSRILSRLNEALNQTKEESEKENLQECIRMVDEGMKTHEIEQRVNKRESKTDF